MKAVTQSDVCGHTKEMRNFSGFPGKARAVKSGRSTDRSHTAYAGDTGTACTASKSNNLTYTIQTLFFKSFRFKAACVGL